MTRVERPRIERGSHRHTKPGRGPRSLAIRRRIIAWLWAVLGFCGLAIGARFDLPALAIGSAVVGVVQYRRWIGGSIRATVGATAERQVAHRLRHVRAETTLFGVWLPGAIGDIDALVLGPMAAMVEVKAGNGRVKVRRDGSVRVGERQLPGRPLERLIHSATAVERLIDVDVDPILCIPGMTQRPRTFLWDDRPIVVCGERHLVRVLKRLERRISADQAGEIAVNLGQD